MGFKRFQCQWIYRNYTMTNLPEPNFIERDAEKITAEWIALYEEKTGKTLQPAQLERILIDVGAYRENLLRIKIQEVAKTNLLNYASIDVLEHLGELVGVKKLDGKPAKTIFRFEIDDILDFDIFIKAGCEIETTDGEYIFKTDEDINLKAGNLSVDVNGTCTTTGAGANNYVINSVTNLLTPIDYISTVYNTHITYGGADEEDKESLRERIRLAPESYSNAGSKGAYKFHTLSAHQSVIDVEVMSSSAGVVDIYPLLNTGNPNSEMIQLITDYLSSEKVRPLTDKVVVHSPQKVNFNINAILYLYIDADENSVRQLVNEQLEKYKKELSSKLGKDIVPTQIIAILNSIYGVYKVELVTPAFQKLSKNQWASLENIEITIGERADE